MQTLQVKGTHASVLNSLNILRLRREITLSVWAQKKPLGWGFFKDKGKGSGKLAALQFCLRQGAGANFSKSRTAAPVVAAQAHGIAHFLLQALVQVA